FSLVFRLFYSVCFGSCPTSFRFPSTFILTCRHIYRKLRAAWATQVPKLVRRNGPGARSGIFHNLMATTLAPVDSREVVRCDKCLLVQFRTNSNLCRRCHTSLDEPEPEPVAAQPAPQPQPTTSNNRGLQVAAAIRALRQRNGISQRQLAMRMNVPRTYVSKIENEKATPTLSSLQRLARALGVTVPDLISGCSTRENTIRELIADDFIAELVPYMSKLNPLQWQSVLSQVRDLSTRPRRSA